MEESILFLRFCGDLWNNSLDLQKNEAVRKRKLNGNLVTNVKCKKCILKYAEFPRAKFTCELCGTVREAMDDSDHPDEHPVSVFDDKMSSKDGLEFLYKIQSYRKPEHIPLGAGTMDAHSSSLHYLDLLIKNIPLALQESAVLVTNNEESMSAITALRYIDLYNHLRSLLVERLLRFARPVLSRMISHPRNGAAFNVPVDPLALELPDYFEKIEHNPMDFGTIKNNLMCLLYDDLVAFREDLFLVLHNAVSYHAETHPIVTCARQMHTDAVTDTNHMLDRYARDDERRREHSCQHCNGQTCFLCNDKCLSLESSALVCYGACCQRIKKGGVYYISADGMYMWCLKCYASLGPVVAESQSSSSSGDASSGDGSSSSSGNLTSGNAEPQPILKRDLLKRVMNEEAVEPWVQCVTCNRWVHQVCALFNDRMNSALHSSSQPYGSSNDLLVSTTTVGTTTSHTSGVALCSPVDVPTGAERNSSNTSTATTAAAGTKSGSSSARGRASVSVVSAASSSARLGAGVREKQGAFSDSASSVSVSGFVVGEDEVGGGGGGDRVDGSSQCGSNSSSNSCSKGARSSAATCTPTHFECPLCKLEKRARLDLRRVEAERTRMFALPSQLTRKHTVDLSATESSRNNNGSNNSNNSNNNNSNRNKLSGTAESTLSAGTTVGRRATATTATINTSADTCTSATTTTANTANPVVSDGAGTVEGTVEDVPSAGDSSTGVAVSAVPTPSTRISLRANATPSAAQLAAAAYTAEKLAIKQAMAEKMKVRAQHALEKLEKKRLKMMAREERHSGGRGRGKGRGRGRGRGSRISVDEAAGSVAAAAAVGVGADRPGPGRKKKKPSMTTVTAGVVSESAVIMAATDAGPAPAPTAPLDNVYGKVYLQQSSRRSREKEAPARQQTQTQAQTQVVLPAPASVSRRGRKPGKNKTAEAEATVTATLASDMNNKEPRRPDGRTKAEKQRRLEEQRAAAAAAVAAETEAIAKISTESEVKTELMSVSEQVESSVDVVTAEAVSPAKMKLEVEVDKGDETLRPVPEIVPDATEAYRPMEPEEALTSVQDLKTVAVELQMRDQQQLTTPESVAVKDGAETAMVVEVQVQDDEEEEPVEEYDYTVGGDSGNSESESVGDVGMDGDGDEDVVEEGVKGVDNADLVVNADVGTGVAVAGGEDPVKVDQAIESVVAAAVVAGGDDAFQSESESESLSESESDMELNSDGAVDPVSDTDTDSDTDSDADSDSETNGSVAGDDEGVDTTAAITASVDNTSVAMQAAAVSPVDDGQVNLAKLKVELEEKMEIESSGEQEHVGGQRPSSLLVDGANDMSVTEPGVDGEMSAVGTNVRAPAVGLTAEEERCSLLGADYAGGSMLNTVNAQWKASALPTSHLSDFIEIMVKARLEASGCACDEHPITIRMVSNVDQQLEVPRVLTENFMTAGGHAMPTHLPYRQKCVLLFQQIDGVDVCLFCLYVQEFDSSCPPPNTSRVYIAYLDSVEYFRPMEARTMVYQEIIVAYMQWAQARGFKHANIWSCPPQRGDNFIFWCHPQHQRTPSRDRLCAWYNSILQRCKALGIVDKISNLYAETFGQYDRRSSGKEEGSVRASARNSYVSTVMLNSSSRNTGGSNESLPSMTGAAATLSATSSVDCFTPVTPRRRGSFDTQLDSQQVPVCPAVYEGDYWVNEFIRLHRLAQAKLRAVSAAKEAVANGKVPSRLLAVETCDANLLPTDSSYANMMDVKFGSSVNVDNSIGLSSTGTTAPPGSHSEKLSNQRKCRDLLKQLMNNAASKPFLAPVDAAALGLEDYDSVVTQRMDLGTVRDKLRAGDYPTVYEFVADVRLTFRNAMLYNPPTHWIYAYAEILLIETEIACVQFVRERFGSFIIDAAVEEKLQGQLQMAKSAARDIVAQQDAEMILQRKDTTNTTTTEAMFEIPSQFLRQLPLGYFHVTVLDQSSPRAQAQSKQSKRQQQTPPSPLLLSSPCASNSSSSAPVSVSAPEPEPMEVEAEVDADVNVSMITPAMAAGSDSTGTAQSQSQSQSQSSEIEVAEVKDTNVNTSSDGTSHSSKRLRFDAGGGGDDDDVGVGEVSGGRLPSSLSFGSMGAVSSRSSNDGDTNSNLQECFAGDEGSCCNSGGVYQQRTLPMGLLSSTSNAHTQMTRYVEMPFEGAPALGFVGLNNVLRDLARGVQRLKDDLFVVTFASTNPLLGGGRGHSDDASCDEENEEGGDDEGRDDQSAGGDYVVTDCSGDEGCDQETQPMDEEVGESKEQGKEISSSSASGIALTGAIAVTDGAATNAAPESFSSEAMAVVSTSGNKDEDSTSVSTAGGQQGEEVLMPPLSVDTSPDNENSNDCATTAPLVSAPYSGRPRGRPPVLFNGVRVNSVRGRRGRTPRAASPSTSTASASTSPCPVNKRRGRAASTSHPPGRRKNTGAGAAAGGVAGKFESSSRQPRGLTEAEAYLTDAALTHLRTSLLGSGGGGGGSGNESSPSGNSNTSLQQQQHEADLRLQLIVGNVLIPDPDILLSSPFVDARHTFMEMCQYRHYQFDTLRRAKHSSLLLLYHLHHPFAQHLRPSCHNCNKIIRDVRWHCDICSCCGSYDSAASLPKTCGGIDYDICSECYNSGQDTTTNSSTDSSDGTPGTAAPGGGFSHPHLLTPFRITFV